MDTMFIATMLETLLVIILLAIVFVTVQMISQKIKRIFTRNGSLVRVQYNPDNRKEVKLVKEA